MLRRWLHTIAHINAETKEEQTIPEHLKNVAELAWRLGQPLKMRNLAYLAGLFHDIGKWRKKFEQYLRAALINPNSVSKGDVNHSSAGAVFLYRRYYHGDELHRLTAQLIAVAVLSHHGLNDCLDPSGTDHFHRRVEHTDGLDYDEVIHNFEQSDLYQLDFDAYFEKAVQETAELIKTTEDNHLSRNFTIAMISRMLLSILIEADRLDTAIFSGGRSYDEGAGEPDALWTVFCDLLEGYLQTFENEGEVAEIRGQVAKECLQFAGSKPGIYRLAVPTGGAKTLGSLRYALNHAKQYGKKHIFYIGPYLSILEQNSEVFRSALGNTDYILEHHSNVVFDETEQEQRSELNRYQLLTENWDHPIVITTFVQFLNTLFSGRTQSVRRFHSLAHSVIIIDEIQSLPINMIAMFNMAMNYYSRLCDSTIVLCSATQPVLDQVKPPIHFSDPPDMIKNKAELYHRLKRVRIEEKKGNLDTPGLRDFIAGIMETVDDALVILNTKAAVRELFSELKRFYSDTNEEILLIHLSTSMCAEHRLNRINQIKERLKKIKVLCVSTSLIEAGVDLSFACVVRSFAGLDSIAQAAGRCNRHGEMKEGIVYLIRYQEERLGNLKQVDQGARCSENIVDEYQKWPERYNYDLLSPAALESFYNRYYFDRPQKKLMRYPIKTQGFDLTDLLANNLAGKQAANAEGKIADLVMFQAFKTAGRYFEVIAANTTGVIVPYGDGELIIENLTGSMKNAEVKKTLRKAQRYTVNLYQQNIDKLNAIGAVQWLETLGVWVLKAGFYDEELGIVYEGTMDYLEV